MKKSTQSIFTFFLIVVLIVLAVLAYNSFGASGISQGTPIPKYSMDKSALLIIDIQEATTGDLSTNKTYIAQSETLINKTNQLVKAASFHQIPVIYIKHVVTSRVANFFNNSMLKGSAGAQFDKRLLLVSDNFISKKKQDAFSNDKLDSILNHHQINRLLIIGLDASLSIKSTAKAAIKREYGVQILDDAFISESEGLNRLSSKAVERITSQDFLNSLNEDQYY